MPMAMACAVPRIVVLALGAGALGGPDALRLLVALAGRNPVVDIGICVFVIGMFTAQLLGTVLLARYVCKAPAGAGAGRGAPATDAFARITLLLSLAAAFVVTACLVVVSGGLGSVPRLVDFAAKYYPIVIATAVTAGATLPCTIHLLRVFREQRNARGRDGAASAERATTTHHAARFIGLPLVAAVCALLVVAIPFGARGRLDALRLSPGFTNMAVAVVVGATMLLARFYRRAHNAGGGGGGDAAPAPATAPRTRRASAS